MRSTSIVAAIATAGLMLTASASCPDKPDNSNGDNVASSQIETHFEKKHPLTLGYSVYDLQNPYWQSYAAGVEEGAARDGIEVTVVDHKSYQQQQVSGSLDLI